MNGSGVGVAFTPSSHSGTQALPASQQMKGNRAVQVRVGGFHESGLAVAYTCTPVPLAKTITWPHQIARGTQKCLAVCQVGTDLVNPSQSLPSCDGICECVFV